MSSLPRASAGVRARIADIRDRVRTSEANAPAPPNETSPPCRSTGTTKLQFAKPKNRENSMRQRYRDYRGNPKLCYGW